jgi:hypothetical protein
VATRAPDDGYSFRRDAVSRERRRNATAFIS